MTTPGSSIRPTPIPSDYQDCLQNEPPYVPNTNPNQKDVMAGSINNAVEQVGAHFNSHANQ